jgi:hypothetical protein
MIGDGPNARRSATSDVDGRYTLTDLVDSSYSLSASADGFEMRSGALILNDDRTLDFQLLPQLRTVTNIIETTLDVSTCRAETHVVCVVQPIVMHHGGSIDFVLTTEWQSEPTALMIYSEALGRLFDSWNHNRTGTLRLSFGVRPAGRYEIRISTRVANPVPLRLEVTHPN